MRRRTLNGKTGHLVSVAGFLSINSETMGEMKDFFMYVSSTDNKELFPEITGSKFTVELPKYLHLPEGEWYSALQDIRILGN